MQWLPFVKALCNGSSIISYNSAVNYKSRKCNKNETVAALTVADQYINGRTRHKYMQRNDSSTVLFCNCNPFTPTIAIPMFTSYSIPYFGHMTAHITMQQRIVWTVLLLERKDSRSANGSCCLRRRQTRTSTKCASPNGEIRAKWLQNALSRYDKTTISTVISHK